MYIHVFIATVACKLFLETFHSQQQKPLNVRWKEFTLYAALSALSKVLVYRTTAMNISRRMQRVLVPDKSTTAGTAADKASVGSRRKSVTY